MVFQVLVLCFLFLLSASPATALMASQSHDEGKRIRKRKCDTSGMYSKINNKRWFMPRFQTILEGKETILLKGWGQVCRKRVT